MRRECYEEVVEAWTRRVISTLENGDTRKIRENLSKFTLKGGALMSYSESNLKGRKCTRAILMYSGDIVEESLQ